MGDAFLSSTTDGGVQALGYAEFLQALLRCALVAHGAGTLPSTAAKLSALLLHLREANARRRL